MNKIAPVNRNEIMKVMNRPTPPHLLQEIVTVEETQEITEVGKLKALPQCPFFNYAHIQINRHLKNKHKMTMEKVYAARKYVQGDTLEILNLRLANQGQKQINLIDFIDILKKFPSDLGIIIPELPANYVVEQTFEDLVAEIPGVIKPQIMENNIEPQLKPAWNSPGFSKLLYFLFILLYIS